MYGRSVIRIYFAIFLIVFLGCGKEKSDPMPKPKNQPDEGVAETKMPWPKTPKTPPVYFENSLGMKFVSVPGAEVKFSIWETRVKDYAVFAIETEGVNGKWKRPEPLFPEFKQTPMHPVVAVSWSDAQAFCDWLTKKEISEGKIKQGQAYRLPTDAEWSAAVGLTNEQGKTPEEKDSVVKGVYPWGNFWPPPKGSGNYSEKRRTDNFEFTAPAGTFPANQYGIHDLGGNVIEWCQDKYVPDSNNRVARGASFEYFHKDQWLSSCRDSREEDFRHYTHGFRCVLTSSPEK